MCVASGTSCQFIPPWCGSPLPCAFSPAGAGVEVIFGRKSVLSIVCRHAKVTLWLLSEEFIRSSRCKLPPLLQFRYVSGIRPEKSATWKMAGGQNRPSVTV